MYERPQNAGQLAIRLAGRRTAANPNADSVLAGDRQQVYALFLPTGVDVGDWYFTVHVPASYGCEAIGELDATLHELQLDNDEALQSFLSLPDVNAMSGDIMESFHENYIGTFTSAQDAVHGLLEIDEWEKEVHEFAAERHLYIENVTPDYEALLERARDAYDVVECKGQVYAFYK